MGEEWGGDTARQAPPGPRTERREDAQRLQLVLQRHAAAAANEQRTDRHADLSGERYPLGARCGVDVRVVHAHGAAGGERGARSFEARGPRPKRVLQTEGIRRG